MYNVTEVSYASSSTLSKYCMYDINVRVNVGNKKLSYCCDSRSYCMQYFNAIHCDRNISTSE